MTRLYSIHCKVVCVIGLHNPSSSSLFVVVRTYYTHVSSRYNTLLLRTCTRTIKICFEGHPPPRKSFTRRQRRMEKTLHFLLFLFLFLFPSLFSRIKFIHLKEAPGEGEHFPTYLLYTYSIFSSFLWYYLAQSAYRESLDAAVIENSIVKR